MRVLLICLLSTSLAFVHVPMAAAEDRRISLPRVEYDGDTSVETALRARRSIREYSRAALTLNDLSQLLWAAQGITDRDGLRTAPSAGALYPLEIYVVAGNVDELPAGIYRYVPKGHNLLSLADGDQRKPLAKAALGQSWVRRAPVVLVIAAVYERSKRKYGRRGVRYSHIEVGHAAQNVYLQAETLGLGTVIVGAFEDKEVQQVLQLPADHEPLALMPVGRKR